MRSREEDRLERMLDEILRRIDNMERHLERQASDISYIMKEIRHISPERERRETPDERRRNEKAIYSSRDSKHVEPVNPKPKSVAKIVEIPKLPGKTSRVEAPKVIPEVTRNEVHVPEKQTPTVNDSKQQPPVVIPAPLVVKTEECKAPEQQAEFFDDSDDFQFDG